MCMVMRNSDYEDALPKIQVLMSTYNGQKYIREQVYSIMNQKEVSVFLLIRDDGSTDQTVSEIKKLQEEYLGKIKLYVGKNIGYRKSFLKLFSYLDKNVDYFAYSDQDDIWLDEKLIEGIKKLKRNPKAWLYSSALYITDERLDIKEYKCIDEVQQSIQSFFIRTRLAGCTFVFTPELMQIASKYSNLEVDAEQMPDHDCLLCMISMLYNKKIVFDSNSYILHRRTIKSVTSGASIKKRLQVEWQRIFKRKYCYEYTAKLLISDYEVMCLNNKYEIDKANKEFLEKIVNYNCSIQNRIRLIFDKKFTCGVILADILIRVKIILGIY